MLLFRRRHTHTHTHAGFWFTKFIIARANRARGVKSEKSGGGVHSLGMGNEGEPAI